MTLFLFQSRDNKIEWLFEQAGRDPAFKPIIEDLKNFGYDIRLPLLGGAGAYQPKALKTNTPINENFIEEFRKQIEQGEHKAQFKLCPRFGRAQVLHTFLHEAYHFHQDMLGLWLTPLEQGRIVQPDLRSHVEITLLCEAMAATEAIRASWRLKEAGHPDAWNGAFFSPNWHGLAKGYVKDIRMELPEKDAAKNCLNAWYKSPQRKFYEKYAFETYKNHNQDYRAVDLNALVETIPNAPDYLKIIPSDFDLEYKKTDNNKWEEIVIGSPAYLWHKHIKNSAL